MLRLTTWTTVGLVFFAAAPVPAMTVRYSEGASAVLSAQQRELIQRIADTAERDVRRLLPQVTGDIVLNVDVGRNVVEETGETGTAMSPGNIRWVINPAYPAGLSSVISTRLRATLFHEIHHLARGWLVSGGTPRTSFMDGVIAEGLATAFARDETADTPLWAVYPDDIAAWTQELLVVSRSGTQPRYIDWMFQHPDGRRWIGYKVGTYIADRAMKASGKTAAALAIVPTSEILRLAGF
jgi:uncharacterized protein YjaZ